MSPEPNVFQFLEISNINESQLKLLVGQGFNRGNDLPKKGGDLATQKYQFLGQKLPKR